MPEIVEKTSTIILSVQQSSDTITIADEPSILGMISESASGLLQSIEMQSTIYLEEA